MKQRVIVCGAGAAGIIAATQAALAGADTILLEKNAKPGVKILASGGTRCNVTSTLPIRDLGLCFGTKEERFLRYGLHEFGPADIREVLSAEGVETAEYPLEKVFPESGRALDVQRALLRRMEKSGVELCLLEGVQNIEVADDAEQGRLRVVTEKRVLFADSVIVCVGGQSYPKTGCVGDGYPWLKALGHKLTPRRPALVPLRVNEDWVRDLTGIAVEAPIVKVRNGAGKVIFQRRRPLLFTHRGLSGPGPMDVSRYLNDATIDRPVLEIDWLPDTSREELDAAILKLCRTYRGAIVYAIPGGFPRRLNAAFFQVAKIPFRRVANELKRTERLALVNTIKSCRIPVAGNEGYDKAEVTAGGVALTEVNPQTMESRQVPGLYIAGEILDLDGPIGGFNFQSAFSTGFVAGCAAAKPRD